MNKAYEQRKINMLYGKLYFWTPTIDDRKHPLANDANDIMKLEVAQSLQWLKAKQLVR